MFMAENIYIGLTVYQLFYAVHHLFNFCIQIEKLVLLMLMQDKNKTDKKTLISSVG